MVHDTAQKISENDNLSCYSAFVKHVDKLAAHDFHVVCEFLDIVALFVFQNDSAQYNFALE